MLLLRCRDLEIQPAADARGRGEVHHGAPAEMHNDSSFIHGPMAVKGAAWLNVGAVTEKTLVCQDPSADTSGGFA